MLFDRGHSWLQSLPFWQPSPDPLTPVAAHTMHLSGLSTGKLFLRDPSEPSRRLATLRSDHTSHECTCLSVLNSSWHLQRKPAFLQICRLERALQRAGCVPAYGAFLVYNKDFNLSFSRTLINLSAWLFTRNNYDPSIFKISIMLSNLSSHLVSKLWERME